MASSGGARVFKGCIALFAAAKSATPKSTATAATTTTAAAAATTTTASAAAKKKKTAVKKSTEKPARKASTEKAGILKPTPISPALGQFLGVSESARTDAIKKIWEYIKLHELQNPTNKREIICDDKLKIIFDGKDRVGFLEIAKLLATHFVKTP